MSETEPKKPQYVMDRKEKVLMTIETMAFIAQVILGFLFYNWAHIFVLLNFGWACLIIACISAGRARLDFEAHGKAMQEESFFRTNAIVDTGIYSIVCHPMYLSFMIISLALMCISQHWLSLILGAILVFLIYDDMRSEEQLNLNKFGDDYRQYMQRTPRMNFASGIVRYLQRKNQRQAISGFGAGMASRLI